MAIVFEQPQPFAPKLLEAAGQAQAMAQGTPTLANLYAQSGRNMQAAMIAEADRFAGNARVGSQLGQRAQESADENLLRREAMQLARLPNARDVFEAQEREAHLVQRAELSAWAAEREMTFAEEQRLKRLQNAVDAVGSSRELDDSDKEDLLLQLRTGISPLEQKYKRSQAKMAEAHAEQYLGQARLAARAEEQAVKLEKDLIESGEQVLVLPGDGPRHERLLIKNKHTGEWYNPLLAARGKGAGGGMPTGRYGDDATGEFSYAKVKKDALAEAEFAYPVKKEKVGDQTVDVNAEKRASYMQEIGAREKAKHDAGRTKGQTQGQSDPGLRAEPFGPDKDANPDQLHQVKELERQRDIVEKLPIPPNMKMQFTAATYAMDALLRKYGTLDRSNFDKMDEQDQKHYIWARNSIDQVSKVGFRGPARPDRSQFGGNLRDVVRPGSQ